jgi:hypothetical protein
MFGKKDYNLKPLMATFIVNKFSTELVPVHLCLVALIFHAVFVPLAHKHPEPVAALICLFLCCCCSPLQLNVFTLIRVPDHPESDIFPAAAATKNPPKR